MIVKIINRSPMIPMKSDQYLFPEILRDERHYILDDVTEVERNCSTEDFGFMKYGYEGSLQKASKEGSYSSSRIIMTRRNGTVTTLLANADVYVCNDDGKTLEKMGHDLQWYPSVVPEKPIPAFPNEDSDGPQSPKAYASDPPQPNAPMDASDAC